MNKQVSASFLNICLLQVAERQLVVGILLRRFFWNALLVGHLPTRRNQEQNTSGQNRPWSQVQELRALHQNVHSNRRLFRHVQGHFVDIDQVPPITAT